MLALVVILVALLLGCDSGPTWIHWEDSRGEWRPVKAFESHKDCEASVSAAEPKVIMTGHVICLPDTIDPRGARR
jgi:hypothetical protein